MTFPLESTFTAPHQACPYPERWHSPDGDSTEEEVSELLGGLVRALQPDYVVETGTAYGYSTLRMSQALDANGHGELVSLDVDPERIAFARELLLFSQTGRRVEIRQQSSLEFVPEHKIGFALFDSLYELRAAEFRRYRTFGALPAGTIVAFHDWTSGLRGHYMDVRAEIEILHREGLLTPVYLPTPRGLAICEVR